MTLLHWLIIVIYLSAPLAAAGRAVWIARRGKMEPAARVVVTALVGSIVGTGVTLVYATAVGGRASLGQFGLAIYFAAAMLFVLKGFDALLVRLVGRRAVGRVLRVAVLLAVGLPYVMAAVMTYRPKVTPRDDPKKQLGFDFTPVEFRATDGVRISGWWIPSPQPNSHATVLVCHGLGANKSNQLIMARRLVPAGYNALAIDFRAHGQSGGQLTSFGDLERRDVLGAVRWLRGNHPEKSRRIVGVGASMGAAALIAAAIEPGEDGQAIEAIVAYGTYDDLNLLAADVADNAFWPPMNWLAAHVSVPIASAHAGTNLQQFRPATLVQRLWPRPIMIIHGGRDEIIPIQRGRGLSDAASFPKQVIWLPSEDHNEIIHDDYAADEALEFLDTLRPMPVI